MKLNFHINLTSKETGACIKLFNDGNNNINCKNFVSTFYRLSHNEKLKHLELQNNIKEKNKLFKEKIENNKSKKLYYLNNPNLNNYEKKSKNIENNNNNNENNELKKQSVCNNNHILSFRKKIYQSIFLFDENFSELKSKFTEIPMNPFEFKELLHTYLHIDINGGELEAAMKMFDLNQDGGISSGMFDCLIV